ncbi:MAG: hypothetical protein J0H69_20855 [Burkholderiales bacterium]|nr:hypothetical protein [Burkholderiales bacterium]
MPEIELVQSPSPAKLRRRGLFRALLLGSAMLMLSATAIIWGLDGRSAGQTWIRPKGGAKYLATPDTHPIAYWIHTTGFVIIGVFIGALTLLMLWKALFSPIEIRRTTLFQLGAQSMTAGSPRIPGWFASLVLLGFAAFLFYVAVKWTPPA